MCPTNALVNVGDPNIIYRTESSMKAIYETMMEGNARIRSRLSKEHSLHPVQVSLFTPSHC